MRDDVMLVFLLFLFSIQASSPIEAARLPMTAATVREFVPAGWMVETEISGDLNRDSIVDLAVVLAEQMPADADKDNPPERQRALLILLKSADGNFKRAALATKVLACTRCGGAFYGINESPTEVKIINGVIIVKQDYGSRELTNETFRFRYDSDLRRFVLIGADIEVTDRLTAETTMKSTNFLTGVMLITKTKLNEKTEKNVTVSKVRQSVSRDKKFIEDVVRGYN